MIPLDVQNNTRSVSTSSTESTGLSNIKKDATAVQSNQNTKHAFQYNKRVSFHDNLEIVEYPIAVGDHPGCSCGTPLTIDWKPQAKHSVSLHDYDMQRQPKRRHKKELVVTPEERYERLLRNGYTQDEIKDANRQCCKARRQRKETIDNLEFDQVCMFIKKITWSIPRKGIKKMSLQLQKKYNKGGTNNITSNIDDKSIRRHSSDSVGSSTASTATLSVGQNGTDFFVVADTQEFADGKPSTISNSVLASSFQRRQSTPF